MKNLSEEERLKEITLMYKRSNKYLLYIKLEDIGFLLNLIEKQKELLKEGEKNND